MRGSQPGCYASFMGPPPLPNCVCAALRQVTRVVTKAYDDALRPSGLRAMQFNILMTIRGMGEPTVSDLVRYIGIDQTTLTRSLQTIERRGWVERIAVPDRRMRAFRITAKGLAALRKAEPLWAEVQARTIDRLGAEAWERIRSPLTDLANARGEVRTLSKTAP